MAGLLVASAAEARADHFLEQHQAATARNLDGVTLTVHTADGRSRYRRGETITLNLTFRSQSRSRVVYSNASYDRSGRMAYEAIVFDRATSVADPLQNYYNSGIFGFLGGGLSAIDELSARGHEMRLDVNEWWRFEEPGRFRLYVTSDRASLEPSGSSADPPQTVTSNVLDIEILPAWIELSTDALASAPARMLRFLDTPAAVTEMARRLVDPADDAHRVGAEAFECRFGLLGTVHRGHAVREMERLLETSVGASAPFLEVLAFLTALDHEFGSRLVPVEASDAATVRARRDDYERVLSDRAQRSLFAAIASGRREARARAVAAVLATVPGQQRDDRIRAAVRTELPGVLDHLPGDQQRGILAYNWRHVESPAMVPALRQILQAAGGAPDGLADVALMRLRELAPLDADRITEAELSQPTGRFGIRALQLPDDHALLASGELDGAIVERLRPVDFLSAHPTTPEYERVVFAAQALSRYGSSRIAGEVQEIYRSTPWWPCALMTDILAYFLRVSPETGIRLVVEAMRPADVPVSPRVPGSGCARTLLEDLAKRRADPALGPIALDYLQHTDPAVAASAVRALRIVGATASRDALWRRLEAWHQEWKGRAEELMTSALEPTPAEGHAGLGATLRESVLEAVYWRATDADFRRVESLCVDANCREEMKDRRWNQRPGAVRIAASEWDGALDVTIGDHGVPLGSIEAVRARLAAYPLGTVFEWEAFASLSSAREAELLNEIRRFAAVRGLEIRTAAAH